MPDESRESVTTVHRLRQVAWIWGPALIVMAAIFQVSSLPDLPALPGDLSDKTGHFWGYFLLGACVLRGTARGRWRGVTAGPALVAWVICVAFGASDEWHQSFVAGRTAAVDDWVADAAGSATAIACLWLVAGLLRRRGRTV